MTDADDIRVLVDGDRLQLTAPRAGHVLSDIRRAIRDFLDRRAASSDLIADLELAASELATNVVRHTGSRSISLAIARVDRGWRLDVADAERVPALDELSPPPPTQPAGRGLLVVTAVMDDVAVLDVNGTRVVRCLRLDPLEDPGGPPHNS